MLTVFFAATSIAVGFLLHCAVVGTALLRLIAYRPAGVADPAGDSLHLFFGICLGMLANMLALAALGLSGHFTPGAVGITALLLIAAGVAVTLGRNRTATGWFPTAGGRLQWATLAVLLMLCVVVSMHPPGHWDDTTYQLPLARDLVRQQAVVLNEHLRFPLFPQNQNMLFALGLMLGDVVAQGIAVGAAATSDVAAGGSAARWHFGPAEIFAQVFATLPLFVMALGLCGASRRYIGSGIPGLLAGLTLFMISPVKSTLGFAYVDNGLALFCWAAALALASAADGVRGQAASRAPWLLVGLLAGAACGIKYFGVVFAAMLGPLVMVVAALRARRREKGGGPGAPGPARAMLGAALVYAIAVLASGSLWYVRSYLISGDPAHPAGASYFGFFLWNEGDLAFQHAEQAQHGVARHPLQLVAAMHQAGVLLWLPALAGLFIRRLPPGVRVLQAAFLGYLLFWFVVTQVPRYLAPVYGVGGFLAFHALWHGWQWALARLKKRSPAAKAAAGTILPAAFVLVAALAYITDRGFKYGREFLHSEAVLATNGGYALYQQANMNAPRLGPRLVQVGFEDGIYFFQGTVIGDWFGPGRYRDLLSCPRLPCPLPTLPQLQAEMARHRAGMLLLNRELVPGLDEGAMAAAGWRVLAANARGVLFAVPGK